jgi:hypothetical protein
MEIIRKEDHLQLFVDGRYFLIPNDIRMYDVHIFNLFEYIYNKLIKHEYTFEIYDRYLTVKIELRDYKKTIQHEITCQEIFPYSDIKITDETTRTQLLQCIQCLRYKVSHMNSIIDDLEDQLNGQEKEYY